MQRATPVVDFSLIPSRLNELSLPSIASRRRRRRQQFNAVTLRRNFPNANVLHRTFSLPGKFSLDGRNERTYPYVRSRSSLERATFQFSTHQADAQLSFPLSLLLSRSVVLSFEEGKFPPARERKRKKTLTQNPHPGERETRPFKP